MSRVDERAGVGDHDRAGGGDNLAAVGGELPCDLCRVDVSPLTLRCRRRTHAVSELDAAEYAVEMSDKVRVDPRLPATHGNGWVVTQSS